MIKLEGFKETDGNKTPLYSNKQKLEFLYFSLPFMMGVFVLAYSGHNGNLYGFIAGCLIMFSSTIISFIRM